MLNTKFEGQVFTPSLIVGHMLEMVEYYDENIYTKTIMEPSFGDGAFLIEIINKIIQEVKDPQKIKEIIQKNVFGIEKDEFLYQLTIKRLTEFLNQHQVFDVELKHNLFCGDTLAIYKQFEKQFDIVIGNPPYVKVHNIYDRSIFENFVFSNGNTDLYVLFYEIGLNMLSENGQLCFITPNSFLKNTSQQNFRDYLLENQLIQEIFDFKNIKVFPTADTYTCICLLSKTSPDIVSYNECKSLSTKNMFFEFTPIKWSDFFKLCNKKPWNLSSNINDLVFLEDNQRKTYKLQDIACIQNGIATLRDSIFIGYVWEDVENIRPYLGKHTDENKIVYFNNHPIESQILHRCVKASKFDGEYDNLYVIYPYNNATPISEKDLQINFPYAYQYLLNNKQELLKRDVEKNQDWFLFGRSQGLKNMHNKKLIFKHIINRHNPNINSWILDEDIIVYSGMFITSNNLSILQNVVQSNNFAKYCCLTGKDMSGGYVSVSTKIVKAFGINENLL